MFFWSLIIITDILQSQCNKHSYYESFENGPYLWTAGQRAWTRAPSPSLCGESVSDSARWATWTGLSILASSRILSRSFGATRSRASISGKSTSPHGTTSLLVSLNTASAAKLVLRATTVHKCPRRKLLKTTGPSATVLQAALAAVSVYLLTLLPILNFANLISLTIKLALMFFDRWYRRNARNKVPSDRST